MSDSEVIDNLIHPKSHPLDNERQRLEALKVDLLAFDKTTFEINNNIFRETAAASYDLLINWKDFNKKNPKSGPTLTLDIQKAINAVRAEANSLDVKAEKAIFFEDPENYSKAYALAESVEKIVATLLSLSGPVIMLATRVY